MRMLFVSMVLLGTVFGGEVVPVPQKAELARSLEFQVPSFKTSDESLIPAAAVFLEGMKKILDEEIYLMTGSVPANIKLERKELEKGLSYRIKIAPGNVEVSVSGSEGAAHAAATLLQLAKKQDRRTITWPEGTIEDGPDQGFRCFMVDMGRNPHSPKTLRHVIDTMWFYKVNYLQLHLTDDQLFSWPSKAFPKLYSERAGWTWEDFVELEAYSQARGVTIIPEVEIPGHSGILRREYPEVFGKTATELATLESAQKGAETLIEEVLSVFKATPYYHMGGDEAYGVPHEVQRDFINRINGFVKSKGKQLIVWEGPHLGEGENKVATDVVHMIWRSTEVMGQMALDAGYEIVNASWDPLYIVDHYPRTMFTAVDVERCYGLDTRRFAHINHGFKTFGEPHFTNTTKGVLGFCMPWWEGREENILPLCVERLAAAGSAAWNREGEDDFADFQKRQDVMLRKLEKISGFELPKMPVADEATQKDNLAYLAKVTPSDGASQPVFGPQRLTNGIPDQFDHFLGFPTVPEPLEILIELREKAEVSRIEVHERAINGSWEKYEVLVSADGENFVPVGKTEKGMRGEGAVVTHRFKVRPVKFIKILTDGCQDLTFPSFSRLSEVMAFEK